MVVRSDMLHSWLYSANSSSINNDVHIYKESCRSIETFVPQENVLLDHNVVLDNLVNAVFRYHAKVTSLDLT